jgi:hypothetical protein
MKYFKFFLLANSILFSSCAHTRDVQPTPPPVSTTQWLDNWTPTGSFCIDAYVVNAAAAGCNKFSIRELETVFEMRCIEKRAEVEDFWLDLTFVFFNPAANNADADANTVSVPGFYPLCKDAAVLFGVIKI